MEGVRTVEGTTVEPLSSETEQRWAAWRGMSGPPVPVIVEMPVWETLVSEAREMPIPIQRPRVFRLFMRRRQPRRVLALEEIVSVWTNERGVFRWNEGGYPALSEQHRKEGNAFIRNQVELRLDDAWWIGREQTELRVILSREGARVLVGAWWGRGGTGGLKGQETDGELWPVEMLLNSAAQPGPGST